MEGHIRASLATEIGRPALLLSSPGKIRRTVGGVQMIKTVLYYKIIEENPHPKNRHCEVTGVTGCGVSKSLAEFAARRLQAFWQKKRSFFASYFPAGLVTRRTPETCSRRRRTVASWVLSDTPTSMVMRAKPSLVVRALVGYHTRGRITASMLRICTKMATKSGAWVEICRKYSK